MSEVFLITERLLLREFTEADIDLIYRLDSNPKVMEFLRPPTTTMEEANATYQKILNTRKKDIRFGNWVGISKSDNQPIGWFCLKDLDNTSTIEVGFRLLPEFWGNGYATEGAKALIKYGFELCQLPFIAGVTKPENLRSKNALQKCGLKFLRNDYIYETQVHYFEISVTDFKATQ